MKKFIKKVQNNLAITKMILKKYLKNFNKCYNILQKKGEKYDN